MFYDIVQVIPNEDYTVYVYFEDGKIVCYDAKTLLKKKVFEPLKDIKFFMNACTILMGHWHGMLLEPEIAVSVWI